MLESGESHVAASSRSPSCSFALFVAQCAADPALEGPADLIIHHAHVLTVNDKFDIAEASRNQGRSHSRGREKRRGDETQRANMRLLDAKSRSVLPGLYDSHTHPLSAALSEINGPLPDVKSIKDVLAFFLAKAKTTPDGEWIVLRYTFPTRLDEVRFPTKGGVRRLRSIRSCIMRARPASSIPWLSKSPASPTLPPTPAMGWLSRMTRANRPAMSRNAYRLLKGVPGEGDKVSAADKRAARSKVLHLYNEQGLTSIADRNAGRDSLDLYLDLKKHKELTLRVNVGRSSSTPTGTRRAWPNDWMRLQARTAWAAPRVRATTACASARSSCSSTAACSTAPPIMCEPWPPGDTYQIIEEDYRGLLSIPPRSAVPGGGGVRQTEMGNDSSYGGRGRAWMYCLTPDDAVNRLLRRSVTCAIASPMRRVSRHRAGTWNAVKRRRAGR